MWQTEANFDFSIAQNLKTHVCLAVNLEISPRRGKFGVSRTKDLFFSFLFFEDHPEICENLPLHGMMTFFFQITASVAEAMYIVQLRRWE